MRFPTKVVAFKHAAPSPKRKNWVLLLPYEGARVARIRIETITPEIKEVKEAIRIIQGTRTQQSNWWRLPVSIDHTNY